MDKMNTEVERERMKDEMMGKLKVHLFSCLRLPRDTNIPSFSIYFLASPDPPAPMIVKENGRGMGNLVLANTSMVLLVSIRFGSEIVFRRTSTLLCSLSFHVACTHTYTRVRAQTHTPSFLRTLHVHTHACVRKHTHPLSCALYTYIRTCACANTPSFLRTHPLPLTRTYLIGTQIHNKHELAQ